MTTKELEEIFKRNFTPKISQRDKIEEFLKTYFKIDGDYIISDDGIVNTNGAIKLISKKFNEAGFTELPIQFGHIEGSFTFSGTNITTLKGFPHTVDNFCSVISSKQLTSLEFSPKCKWFYCHGCEKLPKEGTKIVLESLSKKCTDGISTLDGLNCEEFFGNNLDLQRIGTHFTAKYFEFTEFPTPTAGEMRRFIQLNPKFNTDQEAPWIQLIKDYYEHKDMFIAIGDFETLYNEPWMKPEDNIEIINSDVTMGF